MANELQQYQRILVIDDNEAIQRDFEKILASKGAGDELSDLDVEMFGEECKAGLASPNFELSFASQGKDGFELLKVAAQNGVFYGAAFVDMRMPPGWDGVETIENLWKIDPDLQVVICTAYSDRSWHDIFKKLGRTDKLLVLKKPFDEIEVLQLATSLSEKRRLLERAKLRVNELTVVVKTQETELKDAHKDAEVLIDSMASALVSIDEHGFVSRWNHVAASLFETPAIKAIGERFRQLPIAWTDCSVIETAMNACSIVQQKQIELQFVDGSGTTKTLDATICPILNDATSKARLIVATDVTIQKALQSQLDQALRLESVGQLSAGVVPAINSPMQ